MATTANYSSTPRTALVTISTANTARNGSGTIASIFSAGASGSRIDDINIVAQGTTTAGVVRLYLYNGTTHFLLREVLVSAITPSTTQAVFSATLVGMSLVLASGWALTASTNNAESFNICVTRAGDF
jgi:hypothetical protein